MRIEIDLIDNSGPSGDQNQILTLGPWSQRALYSNDIFPSLGNLFFGTAYFYQVDEAGDIVVSGYSVHPIVLLESYGTLSSVPVTNLVPIP